MEKKLTIIGKNIKTARLKRFTENLTTDFVITDEEGNQFTIEQIRAKSIMSDTKIKKPGE